MHLKIWDGAQLVDIQQHELRDFCRQGVYVCCKADGHGGECGQHLWVYVGADPLPPHHLLAADIRKNVPHVNGNGAHV